MPGAAVMESSFHFQYTSSNLIGCSFPFFQYKKAITRLAVETAGSPVFHGFVRFTPVHTGFIA